MEPAARSGPYTPSFVISTGPEAADQRARASRVAATRLVVGLATVVSVVLVLVLVLAGLGVVGAVIGVLGGGGVAFGLYATGDRRLRARLDARSLEPDAEPRLRNLLDGLAATVGVADPAVLVVDDDGVNLGLIGVREPPTLVVTTGLTRHLDRLALEGAVAHELHRMRCSSHLERGTAAALVGWASPALVDRLAGDEHDLDRAVVLDAEATRHTRYPPGLRAALEGADAHPGPARASLGVSWMVEPTAQARADLQVRIAALAER